MCARLGPRHAVVPLLHIRLLFGLLSTLCVGDMQSQICAARGASVVDAVGTVGARHEAPRDERASRVELAPPHARHMFPGELVVDEVSHDDEDLSEWAVSEHRCFPKSTCHDFLVASVTQRRAAQAELERPPRA